MKMGNGKYFVNFTNHPSKQWSDEQIKSAEVYGEIIDMPFPQIDPDMSSAEVKVQAKECVDEIMRHNPGAVLCQGEFTLCHNVVNGLKEKGVIVMAACSERMVEETPEGKMVRFEFRRFREF